jgi:hypothetical protein
MTLSTHTTIGAIIGLAIGNPVLGFIAGFVSHLLLDTIPHGDTTISKNLRVYKRKKAAFTYGTIDGIAAIYLVLILSQIPNKASELSFTLAIIGSVLPDLLVGLYDITKSKFLKPINDLHFYFHNFFTNRYKDIKLTSALLLQILFIAIIINQI